LDLLDKKQGWLMELSAGELVFPKIEFAVSVDVTNK
jgi:hypothetical protein